eukprot:CAMPEP_0184546626 /NCGR_PEP_ID=MMETSP0199_2-20130426/5065_1 /TAXON_ID=1112570 /ORGANISM="Thraustochytrium sp., Strain LLF1b" /LENGTH=601 /DNA_ID=CAMNT_0026941047 /DNA_START=216 /DNA_END=2017 /DNA_ORIENTATION=+
MAAVLLGAEQESVRQLWKHELGNLFDETLREHAVRHAHLIAAEIGADETLRIVEEVLLPHETSDLVFRTLATSLGKQEFASSKYSCCFLAWLLENPHRAIRKAATNSVLEHAERGQPMVTFPGLIDLQKIDAAPLDAKLVSEREENAGQKVPLVSWLSVPGRFKSFYQRVALCELMAAPVETGLSREQESDILMGLAKDPIPEVRLAFATHLGVVSENTSHPQLQQRAVSAPILRDLMLDSDDLVQAGSISSCLKRFLGLVDQTQAEKFIRDELGHSPSWRARLALAKEIPNIFSKLTSLFSTSRAAEMEASRAESSGREEGPQRGETTAMDTNKTATGSEKQISDLRSVFIELFTDPEPDVRAEAARNLQHFAVESEFVSSFAERLVEDEDNEVRKGVLHSFPGLVKLFPNKVAQLLVKIVLVDNEPEIRTQAIETFFSDGILAVLPEKDRIDAIGDLYKATTSLNRQQQQFMSWRTTARAVEAIPLVIRNISPETWIQKVDGLGFFRKVLQDQVHHVRLVAINQIPVLVSLFGVEWAKLNISPVAEELYRKSSDYNLRITALELIYALYKAGYITSDSSAIFLVASKDPVRNVREKASA